MELQRYIILILENEYTYSELSNAFNDMYGDSIKAFKKISLQKEIMWRNEILFLCTLTPKVSLLTFLQNHSHQNPSIRFVGIWES